MSHLVETMAYVGEKPWHGLGVKVTEGVTPKGILEAANLDWEVKKVPTYYKVDEDSAPIELPSYAICRETDGRLLTTVKSKDWQPVQNEEAISLFGEFVAKGDMTMETAGSLEDGRIVFVLAKLSEGFTLPYSDDSVESYLLFTNPHVYGRAVSVRLTPIRVVCNNTLTYALSQQTSFDYRVRHNQPFSSDSVIQTLQNAREIMSEYRTQATFLTKRSYTSESLSQYLTELLGEDSKGNQGKRRTRYSRALEIVETQPGANYYPGSFWNAFNAVTYLTDHEFGNTNSSRLNSAWYGNGQRLKQKALWTALDYAKAA